MRRGLALLLGLLALSASTDVATAGASSTRIIVQRAPGLTGDERAAIRRDADVEHLRSLDLPSTEVVRADDPATALAALRRDPDVVYAEPDRRMHIASTFSFGVTQWALDSPTGADMNVPEAWDESTGAGQVVGVVDTGVLGAHRGLAGRIDSSDSRAYGGARDPLADADGHGTFVAGEVAARQVDGGGATGVAPDATVASLRALAGGSGSDADIADAFKHAGDAGIRIVNASFNGPPSTAIEQAIAMHPNTLYVVAAGNDGNDADTTPTYPCSLPLANVLCVSATDVHDQPAPDANRGAHSVDLHAPGEHVYSTWNDGSWRYLDGTSMAAGNVSGEAALVLSARPQLSTHQLKLALMYSGDELSSLAGLSVTGRRADAAAAVAMVTSGAIPADDDEDGVVNARDATPRGDDADGDGVPALDDACPSVRAATANGCPPPASKPKPAPAPAPVKATPAPPAPAPHAPVKAVRVSHASHAATDADHDGRANAADACPTVHARTHNGCPLAKVRSLRVKVSRHSHRVTAKVRADQSATVALRIERRVCRHGHCRWHRVAAHTARHRRSARLARRLARGRYRAVVTLRSAAGRSHAVRRSFRVR